MEEIQGTKSIISQAKATMSFDTQTKISGEAITHPEDDRTWMHFLTSQGAEEQLSQNKDLALP